MTRKAEQFFPAKTLFFSGLIPLLCFSAGRAQNPGDAGIRFNLETQIIGQAQVFEQSLVDVPASLSKDVRYFLIHIGHTDR